MINDIKIFKFKIERVRTMMEARRRLFIYKITRTIQAAKLKFRNRTLQVISEEYVNS